MKAQEAQGTELVGQAEEVELDVVLQPLLAQLQLHLKLRHTTQLKH